MKNIFHNNHKWIFGAFLATLMIVLANVGADSSLAHPPRQEGGQPDFTVTVQTAPDGRATIESQETRLDYSYFAAHGTVEGSETSPAGLVLAAGQTNGTYVSGVINSPLAFTTDIIPLWDVDLPEGTELLLETRLSLDGQSWSDWVANPEAFYPVRDGQHSGNLIWVGSDQAALQFRVTLRSNDANVWPTLKSLTLAFNDTSHGPTDGEIASRVKSASHDADDVCPVKPQVVSRTDWGNPEGQNSPRRPPTYQPVTHIIIHQTETPNDTQPYQDWAGWVRSVWNYHANVLWWGDVGYNYLIDPNGVIYEGRAGGDDVVGIHDGTNKGSMGIGFLGCYGNCDDPRLSVADPSDVMLERAAQLIAWKLGQEEIDPFSSGPYGRFSDIPVIAGGRDVAWTSSPGDNLYNQLPFLQETANDKIEQCHSPVAGCRVAEILFDQPEYDVGDPINLTVKLVDQDDNPLGGTRVSFEVEVTEATASPATAAAFDLIDLTGSYTGSFTDTNVPGDYLFKISASDPIGDQFSCFAEESVTVEDDNSLPHCQITTQADPTVLTTPGNPVNLLANVTLNGAPVTNANVMAHITKPDDSDVDLSLPSNDDGSYSEDFNDTTSLGRYNFSATATGDGFEQCSSPPSSFSVQPPPDGTIVFVEPSVGQLCEGSGNTTTTQIKISQVANLQGFSFKLNYDPNFVRVVDANPGTTDVIEIRVGETFEDNVLVIAANEVNNGEIDFAIALNNAFDGDAVLAEIDWEPINIGNSPVIFNEVKLSDPNGVEIQRQVVDGAVEVISCTATIVSGQIRLQGREDHSGVMVTNEQAHQAHTNRDGVFSIASNDFLRVKAAGYLSAQANVQVQLEQANNSGPINLGVLTLLAGDINGDDLIDIFDLAYLGSRYGSTDAPGDLNADGTVDIFDLAMAANNYGQQGPLTNWR